MANGCHASCVHWPMQSPLNTKSNIRVRLRNEYQIDKYIFRYRYREFIIDKKKKAERIEK